MSMSEPVAHASKFKCRRLEGKVAVVTASTAGYLLAVIIRFRNHLDLLLVQRRHKSFYIGR